MDSTFFLDFLTAGAIAIMMYVYQYWDSNVAVSIARYRRTSKKSLREKKRGRLVYSSTSRKDIQIFHRQATAVSLPVNPPFPLVKAPHIHIDHCSGYVSAHQVIEYTIRHREHVKSIKDEHSYDIKKIEKAAYNATVIMTWWHIFYSCTCRSLVNYYRIDLLLLLIIDRGWHHQMTQTWMVQA